LIARLSKKQNDEGRDMTKLTATGANARRQRRKVRL
jgi:hypothetical protein